MRIHLQNQANDPLFDFSRPMWDAAAQRAGENGHDVTVGTSAADFAAAVRLVEAYVFRRAICAIPTNSMNKTFATFGKALKKGDKIVHLPYAPFDQHAVCGFGNRAAPNGADIMPPPGTRRTGNHRARVPRRDHGIDLFAD